MIHASLGFNFYKSTSVSGVILKKLGPKDEERDGQTSISRNSWYKFRLVEAITKQSIIDFGTGRLR